MPSTVQLFMDVIYKFNMIYEARKFSAVQQNVYLFHDGRDDSKLASFNKNLTT